MKVEPGILRTAAFLDRDGTINVDTGYPHRADELAFTPTAIEAIRHLNDAGILVIVVTNQSGVARGLFDLAQVDLFHDEIQRQLASRGAHIDAFYVAPYHPGGSIDCYAIDHPDRKPGPGMILRALEEWPIDRKTSFMVGDKPSDVEAARSAGIAGLLVPTDTCDLDRVVTPLTEQARERSATGNAIASFPECEASPR